MSKVIVLDIGTHKAQELQVLTGDRIYLLTQYCIWWFDWFKRQIKKLIGHKGRIRYDGGAYISSPALFKHHFSCIREIILPENYLSDVKTISIDPIIEITGEYVKRLKNKIDIEYFPVVIFPHDSSNNSNIVPFYIAENSLSSSLYKNKKNNNQRMILCPAFSFDEIINSLKQHELIQSTTKVIIRMNCEGSELAIIKSLIEHNIFPHVVLGSIYDVQKKHGEEAAQEIGELFKKYNIQFNYFKGSDPATWHIGYNIFNRLNYDKEI